MFDVAKALIIAGLVVGMIGVCLMAFDIVFGLGHQRWLANLRREQEMLDGLRADKHPNTKWLDNWQKFIDEETRKSSETYPERARLVALRGLAVVFLGFLLQLIGTVIS